MERRKIEKSIFVEIVHSLDVRVIEGQAALGAQDSVGVIVAVQGTNFIKLFLAVIYSVSRGKGRGWILKLRGFNLTGTLFSREWFQKFSNC
jgi:hypothetical protein